LVKENLNNSIIDKKKHGWRKGKKQSKMQRKERERERKKEGLVE